MVGKAERDQRRLAAILFVDAVGSSRLMGRDESGTVARLLDHLNQRLAPVVVRHGGRVVRLKGDGGLVEFASAVDALMAAIEFQQTMAGINRDMHDDGVILFRIGLHLGDVIVDGDDIYGDDVNIAARLETEVPPGGIVVSRAVREAVSGRIKATLHPLGELSLKNILRPIRAFRVDWRPEDWPQAEALGAPAGASRAASNAPRLSIVVLPFANIGGDPTDEHFIDGVTGNLTTDLSRMSGAVVIARNTAFTYKGKPVDMLQIGRITYPDDPEPGYLLYLKSSLTGDEDAVVTEYRNRHPSFPHESTADQFFNEGQFEAYRSLGEHIATHAIHVLRGIAEPAAAPASAMSYAEFASGMEAMWSRANPKETG